MQDEAWSSKNIWSPDYAKRDYSSEESFPCSLFTFFLVGNLYLVATRNTYQL
jgi:hypothetical protein